MDSDWEDLQGERGSWGIGKSGKEQPNHIIWRKSCQKCRKDKSFRLLLALEAESLIDVCYSFLLGTWGVDTKGKWGKGKEKAVGVSQYTSKSWQKHIWGREPHCIHFALRPAVTALALSAAGDALNDDFFVLLIFSISFKIRYSVFYCKVSLSF